MPLQGDEKENLNESCHRYLLFEIDREIYGVNLLAIKEVLKNRGSKPVPYMKNFFLGVINLRGVIVSVIDLRIKFNKLVDVNKLGFIIIVETESNSVGVVVDDILCVENIMPEDINKNTHLELDFSTEFFEGVGKRNNDLINIINLKKCITKDDMRKCNE